jgi:hypothetical protein
MQLNQGFKTYLTMRNTSYLEMHISRMVFSNPVHVGQPGDLKGSYNTVEVTLG